MPASAVSSPTASTRTRIAESVATVPATTLSFGVTPVLSDIPAFRSLTGGGHVGSLFPAGDPGGFASSLEAIARSDARAGRPAVRDHFERELSWAAVGHRALAIYRESAARRRFWPTLEASRWPAN